MAGAVISPNEVVLAATNWFGRVTAASLQMPRGWFGRPHDNLLQLTWISATHRKVLLEFDGQVLLILTDPVSVVESVDQLQIDGCAQVTLDWQEYVNLRPHIDDHGAGSVRLFARQVAGSPPGADPDS
jgi:hypothetical protein